MANDFGYPTSGAAVAATASAALTASGVDATTKIPLSKAGARNEIALSELLQGAATVSSANPLHLANGAGGLYLELGTGNTDLSTNANITTTQSYAMLSDTNQFRMGVSSNCGIAYYAPGQLMTTDGSTPLSGLPNLGGLIVRGDATMPFEVQNQDGDSLSIYINENDAYIVNPSGYLTLDADSGTVVTIALTVFGSLVIGTGGVSGFNATTNYVITTDGAGQSCWLRDSAGSKRVNSARTNSTTTFSAMTGVSHNLIAGEKYGGTLKILCNDSVAAEGIKFDFNGGSATMTSFWAAASATVGGTTVLGTAISSSLAGVINYTTITGETLIEIDVSFVCNAAGTFIPRFAQNSHATGTVTVELGSFSLIEDIG